MEHRLAQILLRHQDQVVQHHSQPVHPHRPPKIHLQFHPKPHLPLPTHHRQQEKAHYLKIHH